MKLRYAPGLAALAVFGSLMAQGAMGSPGSAPAALSAAAGHHHLRSSLAAATQASGVAKPAPGGATAGGSTTAPSATMPPATGKASAPTKAQLAAKNASIKAKMAKVISPAERQAAAERAAAKGQKVAAPTPANLKAAAKGGVKVAANGALAPAAAAAAAAAAPHYFGPFPNYANSPLRLPDALVTINPAAGDATGTGATATATVDANGVITGIDVTAGGSGYTAAPDVVITSVAGTGSGASATATIDPATQAVTAIAVGNGGTGYVTPGIKKFVNGLPGLGEAAKNDLGQYIPVAQPDTTTYPGSDYYEIAVVEYREKMHADLPPTRLRGYVQLSTGVIPGKQVALQNLDGTPILINGQQALAVDGPHYLGPLIGATKDRPVRILFRNLLPTGDKGDLFLPVDTTVMGAGMGPNMNGMAEADPQNPMCGQSPKPADCYTENRATLHLHGGTTPWISDGTPHQWITPAGENTPYPRGVSVRNVPDMPDPGPGAQTFFYTNQQSARLMFYHDHAWGITRLNVYAGEAAGYTITDAAEQKLVNDGTIPGAADTLPLIIQDKTFVPKANQLALEDPTWDTAKWGGEGSLWVPHVYMPAQNPGDTGGANAFGRWAYGPWFWPPTNGIAHGPIANPYYDPNCDAQVTWCEPSTMPGTPVNSMGMEAFNDTPLVNGTAYPTVTVDPKSYRLRILNAANDRMWNLQFYQADATGTEVALKAAEVAAAQENPNLFPTPDTTLSPAGPSWVQFGTEGGFLPTPVVVPNQPITWVNDPTRFDAGNVDKHSLLLGPAERADTVVDFSAYAGKTLILYNDAPAAFPARDPRYDYYTGHPDLTSTGGAPTTVPGYGPNTRTIMQIKVAATTPAPAYDLAKLQAAFAHHTDPVTGAKAGVFETSQPPIVVGQGAYNTAYGSAFRTAAPRDGFVRITENSLTFNTLNGQDAASTLTMPLQPKAIQDEQGEAFDPDYGRMAGMLGLETPNAQAGQQQNLILYPYVNPASEVVDGLTDTATPIATASDGTQIWKITQNGVDTHPIHFHLFDVQVINRVGWDGVIRKPDLNELGWKDTVRVSPLEDTIVALRPQIPKSPFGLVDSVRPLNPMMPIGSTAMFRNVNANAQPINPPITNQVVNFGWEYVWHCHILSHEEMDMMRPIVVNVDRQLPDPPVVTIDPNNRAALSWTDGTPVNQDIATWGNPANEVGYRIERAPIVGGVIGAYTQIGTALANQTGFTDPNPVAGADSVYRVIAWNAAGDAASQPGMPAVVPSAPTGLTANVGAAGPTPANVDLTWAGSNWAAGYTVERAADAAFTNPVTVATGVTTTQYTDTGAPISTQLWYRVAATNPTGTSAWSDSATVTTPAVVLDVPTLTGNLVNGQAELSWTASAGANAYQVTRAEDPGFTVGVTTTLVVGATTYADTTLSPGTAYSYQVQASNQWVTTGPSNVVTLTTQVPAPTNVTAVASSSWPLTVTVTWTPDPGATGSVVQRSTDPAFGTSVSFPINAPSSSYVDITASPATTYYYRVRSTGVGSPSNWSTPNAGVTTPSTALTQVTGQRAVAAASGTPAVVITWNAQPWAATYQIQRARNTAFTAGLTLFSAGVPTWTDTTAVAGTQYYYRVRAQQPGVNGAWSARVGIIPNVPPRPNSLTLTTAATGPGQARVTLTWTQTTTGQTVGGFVIERATSTNFTTGLVTVSADVPAASRTYTDTGLARNVRYYYRIRATNSYGASTWRTANIRTPV